MATVEIDGKRFEVDNGKMIIEVADEAGIYIPRFCYHKKLSVAANCRMCLVEVENSRKTLPACATPITDGMKVFTKSAEALRSQKAVMDFLLINHPLDCPICDQGGECELQDLSMGFGHSSSQYEESKRAVNSDDLGSLIATEMTRCIHCTRCVRFGDEIAGVSELGATDRGEHMQIGTYVKHSMVSEVSGNVIDLCPVGALTSKPYRYQARSWEMSQHEHVAPHDCLGSNIYVHTRRNELMRVVPREQETINETWLSDRDRFSYLGLKHQQRATSPMIKRDGIWEEVDWQTALQFTASNLAHIIKNNGPEQVAGLAGYSQTLEEYYLLQKWLRDIGVNNIDHRIKQSDFRDQSLQSLMPKNSIPYHELETQKVIMLIGCNIAREVPLASTRVRKAQINGAKVYAINSVDYAYHFAVTDKLLLSPHDMVKGLANLVAAAVPTGYLLTPEQERLLVGLQPTDQLKQLAAALREPHAVIVTGALLMDHPEAALLRSLTSLLSALTGANIIHFLHGSNSPGAWLAGVLPHRGAAGTAAETIGMDVQTALAARLKAYMLLGIEPEFDVANPYHARQSLLAAEFVVAMTAYTSDSLYEYANVILPIATFAETSGTYINLDQTWQTVAGTLPPQGQARPAWKVLRVLGNLMHCKGFEYLGSEEITQEISQKFAACTEIKPACYYPDALPLARENLTRIGEWPLYRIDPIVRRSHALQTCGSAEASCIRVHPDTAKKYGLTTVATISQSDIEITLPLEIDERIVRDAVWVANGMPETIDLGHSFAAIMIKP